MRPTLLLCTLVLAGCDDGAPTTSPPPDLATPDLASPDLAACLSDCPCASGLTCVTSTRSSWPFAPTCLQPCQTDADSAGRACVAMLDDESVRYCLAPDEPHTCGLHCDPGPPRTRCIGGNLASNYVGLVCGDSFHYCPNGCVEDAPDAGYDPQGRCL